MKISSLLILAVAITALAYLSPTLVNPVLAQTTTNTEDTTEEEGANTNTAQQDYEEFQRCLTEAEGGDNFATEDEIRECFQPIYIGGEAAENEDEDEDEDEDDNDTNNQ
jgi:hypothetical protein